MRASSRPLSAAGSRSNAKKAVHSSFSAGEEEDARRRLLSKKDMMNRSPRCSRIRTALQEGGETAFTSGMNGAHASFVFILHGHPSAPYPKQDRQATKPVQACDPEPGLIGSRGRATSKLGASPSIDDDTLQWPVPNDETTLRRAAGETLRAGRGAHGIPVACMGASAGVSLASGFGNCLLDVARRTWLGEPRTPEATMTRRRGITSGE